MCPYLHGLLPAVRKHEAKLHAACCTDGRSGSLVVLPEAQEAAASLVQSGNDALFGGLHPIGFPSQCCPRGTRCGTLAAGRDPQSGELGGLADML